MHTALPDLKVRGGTLAFKCFKCFKCFSCKSAAKGQGGKGAGLAPVTAVSFSSGAGGSGAEDASETETLSDHAPVMSGAVWRTPLRGGAADRVCACSDCRSAVTNPESSAS